MYLADEVVAGIFQALSEVHRAPVRIVFTVIEPTPDGRAAFHNATLLVKRLLVHWSEPFESSLHREDAALFRGRLGFTLVDLATAQTLRARNLAPSARQHLALSQGEVIVVAETAGRS